MCFHRTRSEKGFPYNQHVPSNPDILVPDEQVIDTVDIYHLPSHHRKLSLRFLAWCVLGLDIQRGVHDSVEDARVALLLYRYYCECLERGDWERVLDGVYERGRGVGFRVPAE